MNMKKIVFFIVVMMSVMSCLNKGSYSQSGYADVNFEFSQEFYKTNFKDSLFFVADGDEGFTQISGYNSMNYMLVFGSCQLGSSFRGGFMMSYLKGEANGKLTADPAENDMYRVHAASGAVSSQTYAVFYDNPNDSMMPKHDIEFLYKDFGTCQVNACYVNNTTLVARKVQEHFVDGDKLVLKATGHRHDGTTAEADIVLAEFTESKDSVMYNWSVFDLSKLGAVDYVDFKVSSTNPEVPGYFCLDGLLAGIKVEF